MKRPLIFIMLLLFSLDAQAQEIPTLTLSDALKMALQRNIDLIVANERVNQALARVEQNRSSLLPHLNAEASQKRQTRDMRSTGFSFPGGPLVGPFNVYDARIKLTQTIFDPAAVSRLKASRDGHDLSLAESRKAKEDALTLVANLFIEARRAHESLKVYSSTLRRDKKQLTITLSRLKSGTSSPLDMKKARANYAKSVFNWQDAKNKALESRLDLYAALGISEKENFILAWDSKISDKVISPEINLDQQPDLAIAKENMELKKTENSLAKNAYWPTVAINGDYGPSGTNPSSKDSSETYSLGVQASLPLLEGGYRHAKVKEAQSELRESAAILKNTEFTTKAKIATTLEDVKRAEALLIEKTSESLVAEEELKLARQKFQAGHGSSLELTNSEVTLSILKDQKDEALAYYFLAKVGHARALGQVKNFLLDENQ